MNNENGAYMNNTYLDNLVAKGSLRSYEYVDLDEEGNLGRGAYRNTRRLVLQLADGERIVVECFCSGSSENIDPYTKKTWTPEEVIAYMKQSIKEFGHYTFCDEGPEAVMEIEKIGEYLSTLSLDNICDFIHKLRGKTLPNSDRAMVAASLVHYLDSGPWTEEEFQRIADSSPGSY